MTWNPTALSELRSTYASPPKGQGSVGSPPASYLAILQKENPSHRPVKCDGSAALSLLTKYPQASKALSRSDLRMICDDSEVDVIEAYAAVMAWGGQHRRWFRASLHHETALRAMLGQMRGSTRARADDFDFVQSSCAAIRGLGISYFTKLLFFFRRKDDAFILDQWTAKSICALAGSTLYLAPWGGPSQQTSKQEYEDFCQALERLALLLGAGWTGGLVEQALFDVREGKWRSWVRSFHRDVGKSTVVAAAAVPPAAAVAGGSAFQQILETTHTNYAGNALECLPSGDPGMSRYSGGAVRLGGSQGINWQYRVRTKRTTAMIFFQSSVATIGTRIQAHFPSSILSPVFGRGSAPTIEVKLARKANQSDQEHAEEVTDAMSELWRLVRGTAQSLGITHPRL